MTIAVWANPTRSQREMHCHSEVSDNMSKRIVSEWATTREIKTLPLHC